jgi:hypothetical protein
MSTDSAPGSASLDPLRVAPDFLEHRLPESGLLEVPQLTNATFYVHHSDDSDSLLARIDRHRLRG